jgi:hypothetical protein
MTERIPTPLAAKRLVTKYEELRRKREGTWDATTMVSETSPEGAALRAHRASLEKVTVAQEIAVERLKNETPPHEPTSLPTPLTTAVENGTTKAELLPPAKAATSAAEGPETVTTPLAAMGRKRGRRRGRQLSPERMRIVLDSLREYPVLSYAARKAGIHRKTLEYWLKRSEAGDAGYDLEWQGVEGRFHEHCESAKGEAEDKVLEAAWHIAMGTDLKDENGNLVLQANCKQQGKMIRFLLEWLRPEKWGKHPKIDVPQTGAVLVVGGIPHDIPNKVNNGTAASVKARKWKAAWRMIKKTEV